MLSFAMASAGTPPVKNPRHHRSPQTPNIAEKESTMKFTMIAALSIATATTALPLTATAHADPISFRFLSPSGNIGCQMFHQDDDNGNAVCKIRHHTWVA